LLFTTVEFLDSPNKPLPIPDSMRLHPPGGEDHRMAS
jgi:beta-alanine degradation protein BauB